MGEIDTKPIESVQTAITFFGQSNELRKNSPTNDKEVEMESLERELASVKVQLEAKEAAHKQALLKLDHYHKTSDELSTLLKSSDLKKNFYIGESERSRSRAAELESALERMSERLSEHERAREELRLAQEGKRDILNDLNDQIVQKSGHIESLQLDVNELRASSERSAARIGELEAEAERMRSEAERARGRENEAQVEIALLKFEVHKGRSRLSAAEAAEARAQSEKTALYNALQQMGIEAEEIKRENRVLREEASKSEDRGSVQVEEGVDGEGLRSKAEEEARQVADMKRELEAALSKIGELRMRAEQAISRAEAAEKAKAALEEEKRKRRKQKERRRAALEALRQESISREFEIAKNDDDDDGDEDNVSVKSYQPLAKVLNMKF